MGLDHVRRRAEAVRERSDVAAVPAAGVVAEAMVALVLAGAVLAFRRQLLHEIPIGLFLLYLGGVPFLYFNEFARRIGLGAGRVGIYNVPDLITGAGLLFGTAAAIAAFGDDLVPLVVLRAAAEVVVTVVLFLLLRRVVRLRIRPSREVLRRQLGYGVKNYAASLMWLFLLQSDLILCNAFLGNGETGVYSVAVSLGIPVTILAGVVGTLTFQRVSSDESRPSRIANTNRVLRLLLPLVAVPVVVLGASAGWLVPFVYGEDFAGGGAALRLLLPGLLALTLELVVMNFLAGEGSPSIVWRAPVVGLFVNVAANLWAIPQFGIDGAAATSSVAYTLVFVLVMRHYLASTGSSLRDALVLRGADVRALLGRGRAPGQGAPAGAGAA